MMMKTTTMIFTVLLSLSISSFVAAKKYDKSEFLVQGLEDIEPAFGSFEGGMYSGLLPIDWQVEDGKERGKLMFWLFLPDHPVSDDSLIIWFNGGPGCTSFGAGLIGEHSPVTTPLTKAGVFKTEEHAPLAPNPYAWTNAAPVLYVEQPAGTGFSYGPEPQDEDDVSADFYNFLLNFYTTFDDLLPRRLFLMGESYAGMYVPSIGRRIFLENHHNQQRPFDINLAGIGLGNGWVDGHIQGSGPIDYAYWHGMIDEPTRDALYEEWEACDLGLLTDEDDAPFHHFTTPDECGILGAVLKAAGMDLVENRNPNMYDVTTWDTYPLLTSDNATAVQFYNNPAVKKVLHAPEDREWAACVPGAGRRRRHRRRRNLNDNVQNHRGLMLDDDQPISVMPYMAQLLDNNIKVMVYNGDLDLSVSAAASEKVLNRMEWSGTKQWKDVDRGLWMLDEERVAGYAKSFQGLSFIVVRNSGHLVPTNMPKVALDLITRFVQDQEFKDIIIPKFPMRHVTPQTGPAVPSISPPVDFNNKPPKIEPHFPIVPILMAIIAFFAGMVFSDMRRRHAILQEEYEPVKNVHHSVHSSSIPHHHRPQLQPADSIHV